jgi:hypothetical protein
MLFFQALLLLGYAYAHLAWRVLGRGMVPLHLVLLLLPLAVLPITVSTAWAPSGDAEPALLLLALPCVSTGLPFFVVAASSPLLQAWYEAAGGERARDPYWLYAAGNAGSILGLLGYPFMAEPNLTVRGQSAVWAAGYAALVVLFGACALAVLRAPAVRRVGPGAPAGWERLGLWRRGRWIALAFLPSSLMLGMTAHLTTDMPPLPMLWILPLALYLLSFVLSFASRPIPPGRWVVRAMAPALVVLAYLLVDSSLPYTVLVTIHFLAFFVLALGFHGELARDRPAAGQLTEFYLWIALGGALGGVFNSLAAPSLFSWVAEYPLTLAAGGLLIPTLRPVRWRRLSTALDLLIPPALGLAVRLPHLGELRCAVPLLVCPALPSRPLRFGLSIACILASWHLRMDPDGRVIHRERTFFGVLRVVRSGPANHSLFHGYVCHGAQVLATDPKVRDRPLLYYYPTGPMGQVFSEVLRPRPPRRVGLVGLGAGSLASYGLPGQDFIFFEIDAAVARIARDERYFTFLHDSPARCRVVIGDARLTLRKEPDRHFGLIVVDAFSGDSIPVHLLTRNALRMYLAKLDEGGLLAFHITNSYLDFEPELAALAQAESLIVRVRDDDQIRPAEAREGKNPSRWAVMARRLADMGPLAADRRWRQPAKRPGLTAWTDDFSNPLALLRWR